MRDALPWPRLAWLPLFRASGLQPHQVARALLLWRALQGRGPYPRVQASQASEALGGSPPPLLAPLHESLRSTMVGAHKRVMGQALVSGLAGPALCSLRSPHSLGKDLRKQSHPDPGVCLHLELLQCQNATQGPRIGIPERAPTAASSSPRVPMSALHLPPLPTLIPEPCALALFPSSRLRRCCSFCLQCTSFSWPGQPTSPFSSWLNYHLLRKSSQMPQTRPTPKVPCIPPSVFLPQCLSPSCSTDPSPSRASPRG